MVDDHTLLQEILTKLRPMWTLVRISLLLSSFLVVSTVVFLVIRLPQSLVTVQERLSSLSLLTILIPILMLVLYISTLSRNYQESSFRSGHWHFKSACRECGDNRRVPSKALSRLSITISNNQKTNVVSDVCVRLSGDAFHWERDSRCFIDKQVRDMTKSQLVKESSSDVDPQTRTAQHSNDCY